MARYDYRCAGCGVFEVTRPVGTAPPGLPCPWCGGPSTRVVSAPALLSGPTPATRAVEVADRSAHEPAVVCSPLPRARATRRSNPLQAALPRP
jgi:putative FmdB family regulatory protein